MWLVAFGWSQKILWLEPKVFVAGAKSYKVTEFVPQDVAYCTPECG
jgi:hypothetical protein